MNFHAKLCVKYDMCYTSFCMKIVINAENVIVACKLCVFILSSHSPLLNFICEIS